MRNKWYGDDRDLVKWSILIHFTEMFSASRILQIAYFREDDFERRIEIDKENKDTPEEVKRHFRDIRNIQALSSPIKISVFDKILSKRKGEREEYLSSAKKFISAFAEERCIVFLDPDTGLESKRPNLKHVLNGEAKDFWDMLRPMDVLALYQHRIRDKRWKEKKRIQFEKAIGVSQGTVKIGSGILLARDVVLFYVQKQ